MDGSTFDNGNEHFLVFDGPDGSLMALSTQSTYEGAGDHRVVLYRSDDEGVTWSPPQFIAGVKPGEKGPAKSVSPKEARKPIFKDGKQASWQFPLISKSGRLYVVYLQSGEYADISPGLSGTMDCVYSDDNGKTWTWPGTIPMKRSPYDHPDPKYTSNWIAWQLPGRDLKGRPFLGFTRWVTPELRQPPHDDPWSGESVVEFMRFENIDDNPEPKDIQISWFAFGDKALRVPHYSNPMLSLAQEPSIVRLPDQRLFCTMRTASGYIWYSLSEDDGETWCTPRPLLRKDYGKPILSPVFCTPIYQMADGRYLLIHHPTYNVGYPTDTFGELAGTNIHHRRPAFVCVGEYRPDAEQPIWFSASKLLMDNDGVGIGPKQRIDIGGYTSFTTRGGNNVLWHPERKFFLLGKKITDEFLNDLIVPKM